MKIFYSPVLFMLFLCLNNSFAQDAAHDWTVQVNAEINADLNQITLNWLPNDNETPTTYFIFRKIKGANGWGTPIATLPSATLSYTDASVEIGVSYEYYIQYRTGGTLYAWSYINSGIGVQLDANKGDLLLIIDETVAPELSSEIAVLEKDLYTEGWAVTALLVDPTMEVTALKAEIVSQYGSLPNLKALYLLGHVPVPYSGQLNPDAHGNHIGAWPADVYYADIDGNWTDITVNDVSATSDRNHNVPDDGKFDQSKVPSAVELQVSRVDFFDMPAFASSEIELLKDYLDKAHEFKTAGYVPSDRGLIDQGNFAGNPEGFAQNGIRNFTAFFGAENVDQLDYWTTLNASDYLWSYGCGSGSFTSVGGLDDGTSLTTSEMAIGSNQSSFTMLFGSYFGDWDITNNLLRASIANGRTLTCSWAARPNWHYHNMALGENIGYSTVLSQDISSDYLSLTLGDGSFVTGEGVHVSQLGDPSLRMYYVAPPTDVLITNVVATAELSWTASSDMSIDGYNVYRKSTGGLWEKLNTSGIVDSLSFNDIDVPMADDYEYLVKAVKLKTNGSGSFYNESLGALGNTSFFASVKENTNSPDFAIYPNPNRGVFTITSLGVMKEITVLNIAGNVILNLTTNSIKTEVELNNLAPGTYFVRVVINQQQVTKKIVVF